MPFEPARAATRRSLLPAVLAVVGLLTAVLAVVGLLTAAPARAEPAWVWPLSGPHVVSRPFGLGATAYSPGHRGADLPATPGAVVATAGAGRVSYAGLLAGRGVVVVVHGALRTTYEPVAAVVAVGDAVATGQEIGLLQPGHDGCPVAACLHWGLLRGDVYLDPVTLVAPAAVRLLPLVPGAPAPVQLAGSGAAAGLTGPSAPAAPDGLPALSAGPRRQPGRRTAPSADRPAATAAAGAGRAGSGGEPPPPGHRTAVAATGLALIVLVGSGGAVGGLRSTRAPEPGRRT